MPDSTDQLITLSNSYSQAFLNALERLFRDEGGYVTYADDPGGATKFGISARQYPGLDISRLTLSEAAAIYYRDWWQRFDFGSLPEAIGAKLFNLAVNMGPREAVLCIQRALRACRHAVSNDGALGAQTRAAIARADGAALIAALRSEAAGYYRLMVAVSAARGDHQPERFLEGWLKRAYE
jgi:lysozyme family protein